MGMMFKPPLTSMAIAGQRDLGWRELLDLGEMTCELRQAASRGRLLIIERYVPANIAMMAVGAAVIAALSHDEVGLALTLGWLAVVVAALVPWAWAYARRRGRREPADMVAAARDVQLAMLAGGSIWGLLFGLVMPMVSALDAALIGAFAIASIGCTAYSTAIFPRATLAVVGPMLLGLLVGSAALPAAVGVPLTLVAVTFAGVTARGAVLTTSAFLARLTVQADLLQRDQMLVLLLDEFETNGREWLFEIDEDDVIRRASPRMAEALGRPGASLLGQRLRDLLGSGWASGDLKRAVRARASFRNLLLDVVVDGERRWLEVSGTPRCDMAGRFCGFRGVGRDITDERRSQQQIEQLARFDPLTGLMNRRMIHSTVEEALGSCEPLALLFVDLDRFKQINDGLGHAAGDRVLMMVAERLRDTAGAGAIGRLGGDEFAIVLPGSAAAAAQHVAERIVAAMARPLVLDGVQFSLGCSIGIAVAPQDGNRIDALFRAADLALYDIKRSGRGAARRFDPIMLASDEERRTLEAELRLALDRRELRLVYQPIVAADDERIIGFEALLRWCNCRLGLVPPNRFVPVAEDIGLIGPIGAWVLDEACRTAARWPEHIGIAVNLSPLQFDDPTLPDLVEATLLRHGIAPERLELEITESLFLEDRRDTAGILDRLRTLGVRFALDDFGTGYSSLGYLHKVPFSRIKIDRSFVSRAPAGATDSIAIIEAIVGLARRLGMETTAEGAETRAEFEALRSLGCGHVQGYLFGKPMPAPEVDRLLQEERVVVSA